MDDEAANDIRDKLSSDEQLIWAGRPYPPVYLFYNGGAEGILSIFPIIGVAITFDSWIVALLLPMLLVLAVVGRIRGEGVRYGLTDKRAIITAVWPWHSVQVIPIDRFNVCIRQNFNKKIGSVMFRKTPEPFSIWRITPFRADAFVGLSDADKVEKLIEKYSHHSSVHV